MTLYYFQQVNVTSKADESEDIIVTEVAVSDSTRTADAAAQREQSYTGKGGAAIAGAAAGAAGTLAGAAPAGVLGRTPSFYRSRTDSLVSYAPATSGEAPATGAYITKRGELNFFVLLKVRTTCEAVQVCAP